MAKKTTAPINEYQQAMDDYAKRFEFLETDAEKIHQTPDVFIGELGNKGYITMVREIVQNSFDIIAKSMRDPSIKIMDPVILMTIDDTKQEVTIEDHGSGIPFGMLEQIFGNTHSSSNYNKKEGDYDAGKNGCGSTVVNCLSEYFIVESYVAGVGGRRIEFKEGVPVKKEHDIPNKTNKQGTVIKFKPSTKYMGAIDVPWTVVFDLIKDIVPLTAIGTTVIFTGVEKGKKPQTFTLENKDGIRVFLSNFIANAMVQEIPICVDDGTKKIEVLFTYSGQMEDEQIKSFCNTSPTVDHGTHVDGTIDGICKWFKNYMNTIYLAANKSKLVVTDKDIKQGLKAVISAYLIKAVYKGQAKDQLTSPEMRKFCRDAMCAGLEEWSKVNTNDLKKLCEFFKDMANLRQNQEKSATKVMAKYKKSSLNRGLPAKFVPANNKKHLELFLVEGDSALGTAKTACNHDIQALYPFRGKCLNAFENSRAAMFENEEINGLVTILNIQPANPAKHQPCEDISKCPYDKIIFFADADDDGSHIDCLWLIFFMKYYPELIIAGRVYRCVPPLYGAKVAGKMQYFPDDMSFYKYVQQEFCKENEVKDIDSKKKISSKDLIGILLRNKDFVSLFNSCAASSATPPIILEQIVRHRDLPFAKFKKAIESKFPYTTVSQANKKRYIETVYDYTVHKIYVDDLCLPNAAPCFASIDNEKPYFMVNGQQRSLYELCYMFASYTPKVTRYKGLGENKASTLAETAVLPNGSRTLIQYTLEDAEQQIMELRNIISNKYVFLQNIPDSLKD